MNSSRALLITSSITCMYTVLVVVDVAAIFYNPGRPIPK
uniref:Uncharacterized protein n=1 Tax=Rhizophora mucronata TaxID=61149 RepID=A0A2P2PQ38_RHIMU